jgi:hypothetical protein
MLKEFLLLTLFYGLELFKVHNNIASLKRYNILNEKVSLLNYSITNMYKCINKTDIIILSK